MNMLVRRRIALLRETAERYRNYCGRMLLDADDEAECAGREYAELARQATDEADRLEGKEQSES